MQKFLPEDGAIIAETRGRKNNSVICVCVHFVGVLKTLFMKKCTQWTASTCESSYGITYVQTSCCEFTQQRSVLTQ
jgi:hypothetical protein